MNTRLIYASILSLGLLTSVASAQNGGNSFCDAHSSYDRESLTCVSFDGKAVTDDAAFSAVSPSFKVAKQDIGDFINESAAARNERTGN